MRNSEFFDRVPDLFRRANLKEWEAYEETLFSMRRPVTYGNYHQVKRFVGAESASGMALRDARVYEELNRILGKARYPRAGQITRLEEFADGSAELATALLHFNNPAYPIFDALTAKGLHHLGLLVSFVPDIREETAVAYQSYINAIQDLKDAIPYQYVPEKNYYLTRIVQECLRELGLQVPAAVRAKAVKTSSQRTQPSAKT